MSDKKCFLCEDTGLDIYTSFISQAHVAVAPCTWCKVGGKIDLLQLYTSVKQISLTLSKKSKKNGPPEKNPKRKSPMKLIPLVLAAAISLSGGYVLGKEVGGLDQRYYDIQLACAGALAKRNLHEVAIKTLGHKPNAIEAYMLTNSLMYVCIKHTYGSVK